MGRVLVIPEEDFNNLVEQVSEMSGIMKKLFNHLQEQDEKLMSQTKAAKMLGITPQTLYRYVKDGLIKPIYKSNRPYYTQQLINEFKKNK